MTAPDVYTVREAAEVLRISERHARRLIAQGDLPAIKWGRLTRVPRIQIEALLAGQPVRVEADQ